MPGGMLVNPYKGGANWILVSRCSGTGSTLEQLLGGAIRGLLAERVFRWLWCVPPKPYWWENSDDSIRRVSVVMPLPTS